MVRVQGSGLERGYALATRLPPAAMLLKNASIDRLTKTHRGRRLIRTRHLRAYIAGTSPLPPLRPRISSVLRCSGRLDRRVEDVCTFALRHVLHARAPRTTGTFLQELLGRAGAMKVRSRTYPAFESMGPGTVGDGSICGEWIFATPGFPKFTEDGDQKHGDSTMTGCVTKIARVLAMRNVRAGGGAGVRSEVDEEGAGGRGARKMKAGDKQRKRRRPANKSELFGASHRAFI